MGKDMEMRIRNALTENERITEQSVDRMVLLARMQWNAGNQKRRIRFSELVLSQIRFVGWKMWIVELIAAFVPTVVLIQCLRLWVITPRKGVFLLSCLTILISMLWIPFFYRSSYYQMMEIEAAAFFSIKLLLLSRTLILFAGELAAIVGISVVSSMYEALDFRNSMVNMLFLFGVSCNGILFLVRRARTERLCRYVLAYGLTLLLVMALFVRFLPQFFDGAFQTGIVLGSCILLGSCIYQGYLLMKWPEEITYA